ncbi:MAG: helix-turn-helix domain-containing protein [Gemmatimonas sp.]
MLEIDALISAAAAMDGLTTGDILSGDRRRRISRARQAAMWLADKMTDQSLPAIASKFHRHHSTVIYSIRAYERYIANDPRAKARSMELLDRMLVQEWINAGCPVQPAPAPQVTTPPEQEGTC